jgi:hypothetical protein
LPPKKPQMLAKLDILLFLLESGKEFLQDVIVKMELPLILLNVFIELTADLLLLETLDNFINGPQLKVLKS